MDKPQRPKRNADGRIWELYWERMEQWKAWRRENARSQGRHPGSTRHMGGRHESRDHPYPHADRRVTDLDGNTTKEHSTDPRDMGLGDSVAETMHDLRQQRHEDQDDEY